MFSIACRNTSTFLHKITKISDMQKLLLESSRHADNACYEYVGLI